MSLKDLELLLAEIRVNQVLRERLLSAPDLDSAEALARASGFLVTEAEWIDHQANFAHDLSDLDLSAVAAGADKRKDVDDHITDSVT
jgi:predicted ribosomally synthesized peptide with nif11-like leader